MRLTESEERIFAHLKERSAISMEELMNLLPGTSRHSLAVRMKYLTAKLAPEGWIIGNGAGVGRGKTALYTIEKKF